MTKLYIPNPSLIRASFAKVATKSISSKIQKQTVLMMLSLLLLSFSSFGQTFTSARSGEWHTPATWGKTATGTPVAGTHYPSSSNDVVINGGNTVTVSINTAACAQLDVFSAQNNGNGNSNNSYGTLEIKANSILSIKTFASSFKSSFDQARVIIRKDGELKVSGVTGLSPWTNNYHFEAGSKVTYDGSANQAITNLNYQNLDLSGTGTKAPATGFTVFENLVNSSTLNGGTSSITVSGNVTNINSGIINAGNSTINIGGNFVTVKNAFNKGTGLINYNGGNQSTAGVDYHNLQFSGTGIKTATDGLSVANDLEIISTVTFDAAGGTHKIMRNLSNAGRISAAISTIEIGGNFTNSGTFDKGTASKVVYNGNTNSINQNVAAVAYHDLTFTGLSTKTATGNVDVSNTVVTDGGSFIPQTYTFTYNGGTQTIAGLNYHHLTLAGTNTKNSTSGLNVAGNFITNTGSSFNAGPFTHTITGNWTNDGSFTAGTSTIILNGNDKTIKSTNGAFNNLTISNGFKTLYSNVGVNGILNLQNELYTGQNFALQLNHTGQLASAETATEYITGTVSAFRTIKSGSVAAPTVEPFGNIGISFTNTEAVTADVTIIVTRTTGMSAEGIDGGKVSASRIYNITSGTLVAAPGLQASFSFLNREMSEAKDKYSLYVERVMDNALKYSSITSTYSSVPADHTYRISDVQHLGRYTIAAAPTPVNPQPVELAWFKAQRQAQGVVLTWETASEEENKGFEVQVSTNGKNFDKVAFVESKVVNSTVAQRYSYADNSTVAYGTRYYRLAQVDLDGTTTYSKIVALNMNAAEVAAAAAYPNPFDDGQQVTVRLPQGGESRSVSVVLTNTHGQVVFAQQAQVQEGQVELAVNTSGAGAKGVYLLNVIDKGTKHTFKLLKK